MVSRPRHNAGRLASRFRGEIARGRVGELKSAPELGQCGLLRTNWHQFEEHLPSDEHYRSVSAVEGRHDHVGGLVRLGLGGEGPDGAQRSIGARVAGLPTARGQPADGAAGAAVRATTSRHGGASRGGSYGTLWDEPTCRGSQRGLTHTSRVADLRKYWSG